MRLTEGVISLNGLITPFSFMGGGVAAASVPEPGILMLMGTGLAGLIATRKRFW